MRENLKVLIRAVIRAPDKKNKVDITVLSIPRKIVRADYANGDEKLVVGGDSCMGNGDAIADGCGTLSFTGEEALVEEGTLMDNAVAVEAIDEVLDGIVNRFGLEECNALGLEVIRDLKVLVPFQALDERFFSASLCGQNRLLLSHLSPARPQV